MTATTIHNLAFAEYDFASIDARITDLALLLESCSGEVPECGPAAFNLTRIKYALRSVLLSIDKPLSDAIEQQERLDPPPF